MGFLGGDKGGMELFRCSKGVGDRVGGVLGEFLFEGEFAMMVIHDRVELLSVSRIA